MEIQKQQVQNLVGFLQRVQLTGNEVPAFNELTEILTKEYEKQNTTKEANPETESVPTNDSKPKK